MTTTTLTKAVMVAAVLTSDKLACGAFVGPWCGAASDNRSIGERTCGCAVGEAVCAVLDPALPLNRAITVVLEAARAGKHASAPDVLHGLFGAEGREIESGPASTAMARLSRVCQRHLARGCAPLAVLSNFFEYAAYFEARDTSNYVTTRVSARVRQLTAEFITDHMPDAIEIEVAP